MRAPGRPCLASGIKTFDAVEVHPGDRAHDESKGDAGSSAREVGPECRVDVPRASCRSGSAWTRRAVLHLMAASATGCCFGVPTAPVEPTEPRTTPLPMPAVPSAAAFTPVSTHVFSIGVLSYAHNDLFPSFPAAGRRDDVLVDAFVARGVLPSSIVRVRDAEATRAGILTQLDAMLARLPSTADLVVYFAGHGFRDTDGRTYFAAFDTGEEASSGVSHEELLSSVGARANRVLFLIDCCYSGALGELVLATQPNARFAVLASSLASEISTGAWTFTDAVIEALHGAAVCDTDHDGRITLADVANYAESELAFADGQLATYVRTAGFPSEFLLGPAGVLPFARFGENVEVAWRNRWWPAKIVDRVGEGFLVHYVGFEQDADEVVSLDRIRPFAPLTHEVGTSVQVRWHGEWFPAVVTQARLGLHRVHYDGFSDAWDEWVSRPRIRLRHP